MITLPLELRSSMAAELVNVATSENLKEVDWSKNIEICELLARDHGPGKDVIKSIKKRLKNKNPNVQLFAAMLLEMLLNNCGEHIHKQVIDNGIIPILVKIVKKSCRMTCQFGRGSFFFWMLPRQLLEVQLGSFLSIMLHTSSYQGVQFPQRSNAVPATVPTSNSQTNNFPAQGNDSTRSNGVIQQPAAQTIPDSSIIQQATSVLEVLRDVLDALDAQTS